MIVEYAAWVTILVGSCFSLLGGLGIVRLPDVYNRLHASTKCTTLGISGILLGTMFLNGWSAMGTKSLLTIVFLFLTAPVGAHAIARAAYIEGVPLWGESVLDDYAERAQEIREEVNPS